MMIRKNYNVRKSAGRGAAESIMHICQSLKDMQIAVENGPDVNSYVISVIHGGRVKFFSWSEGGIYAITPDIGAAARFGTVCAALHRLTELCVLRRAGAVITVTRRGYSGIPLLRWHDQDYLR